MNRKKAIIIGGSLAGMLAANLLRAAGWHVDVFERSGADLEGRGAGLGLHDELLDVLRRVGITVDETIGVLPKSRTCYDLSGKVLVDYLRVGGLSSWKRLYAALKGTLPTDNYHFVKTLKSFDQSSGRVTAHFTDGTTIEGDLLIGADGLRSTVRSQLFPEVQPRYAGYVVWRGTVEEAAMPADLHAEIFERNIMSIPEGEVFSASPTPGKNNEVRPGRRSYNMVWYHPMSEAGLRDLSTDAEGRYHAGGIPPHLIRPEHIAAIRAVARRVLAPQCAAVVQLPPKLFFQTIYDLTSPRMVVGRVALLGDAAFVARPHVSMGVTKAALDAACLADELSAPGASIDSALAEYDRQQRAFGDQVVERGRWVGAHLEAQNLPREQRDPAVLQPNPEQFMRSSSARINDIPQLLELVIAHRKRVDWLHAKAP